MQTPDGFSLIELMIVISIISILAAIAIPTYQTYTQRARFSEVITTTALYKTAIALALQQGADIAELENGVHGIPDEPKPTKNLASLKIENGMIIATGTELVKSATYILTPAEDGATWMVSGSCIKYGFCNA